MNLVKSVLVLRSSVVVVIGGLLWWCSRLLARSQLKDTILGWGGAVIEINWGIPHSQTLSRAKLKDNKATIPTKWKGTGWAGLD